MAYSIHMDRPRLFISSMARRPVTGSPPPSRLRLGTGPEYQCQHHWLKCEPHLSFPNRSPNSGGTSFGSDRTFTTLSATGAPVVTTSPATNVASFSATLNGSLDPHGLTTSVHFQYGTTTSYGFTTAAQSQTGSTFRNISANIIGLSASHIYHFRIVATNSGGTRYGSDRTFTTLSATGPPSSQPTRRLNVASFSATLNGSLDPHGLATTVHFQYGTTTGYGLTTAAQSQTGSTTGMSVPTSAA